MLSAAVWCQGGGGGGGGKAVKAVLMEYRKLKRQLPEPHPNAAIAVRYDPK